MPELGPLHPQIIHFVVALGLVGVALRLVSLTGRLAWTRPAGAALLILTALASVVAVQSGHEAHEVVEQIPGVRAQVNLHEDLAEDTRDLFLVVGGLKVLGLLFGRKESIRRWVFVLSGVAGVAACVMLYRAADAGGNLVYSYAGGPGLRTGRPADMERLLVAGLFVEARAARQAGQQDEAARLTDELARQLPGNPDAAFLQAQSRLRDRHDPAGALAVLAGLAVPADSPRIAIRKGLLTVEALRALGLADSAQAVWSALRREFPGSRLLREGPPEGGAPEPHHD